MRKISGSVFFFKKVYSVFVLLTSVILIGVFLQFEDKTFGIVFSVFFGLAAFFQFYIYKEFLSDLADEVYDEGDTLLFRKGDTEQRIKLKDIVKINYERYRFLERIILKTNLSGPIGNELVFKTPGRINLFSRTPFD